MYIDVGIEVSETTQRCCSTRVIMKRCGAVLQISKVVGFKVEPKPDSSLAEMTELGLTKHLHKSAALNFACLSQVYRSVM